MNENRNAVFESIRKHIRHLSRIAQSFAGKEAEDTDLSPSEMQVLRACAAHSTISQKKLVEHLAVDKAAVARLTESLEKKGYVSRECDESDKRQKLITATERGREIRNELTTAEAMFYERVLRNVTYSEILVLDALLESACKEARALKRNGFKDFCKAESEENCNL